MSDLSILEAVESVRAEVRALRMELAIHRTTTKTPRQVRTEKRHKLLRELAASTGIHAAWHAAKEVSSILCGSSSTPGGQERTVNVLKKDDETPYSREAIYRVLKGQETDGTDVR